MNFWQSIKAFFSNLGHTVLADIVSALPEVKQIALQAIEALIDEAIIYIENKYANKVSYVEQSLESKLMVASQKRNECAQRVRAAMAMNPNSYKPVSDSLLNFGIEARYQLKVTLSEGNGGDFIGGNSNA